MNKMRKMIIFLCLSAMVSSPTIIFGASESDDAGKTYITADSSVKLDQSEKQQIFDYGKKLQAKLKTSVDKDYETQLNIQLRTDGHNIGNILQAKVNRFTKTKITDSTKEIEIDISKSVIEDATFVFRIDDNTFLELTPSYVILSSVNSIPLSTQYADESLIAKRTSLIITPRAVTKSVTGSATKKITNYEGLQVATVHVSADFYYNGTKAWYKGGLTGYLTCPSFGNHVVISSSRSMYHANYASNGSSYCAAYYGKINQINDILGIPVIIKTRLIQAMTICYNNGTIKNAYENYVV